MLSLPIIPDYRGPTFAEKVAFNTAALREKHKAKRPDAEREIMEARAAACMALASGFMCDAELRGLAQRRAWLMGERIDALRPGSSPDELLTWINGQVITLQGRAFEFEGDAPRADQLRGMLARARCVIWWRRQLRRAAVLDRETRANKRGEVCATKKQPYITHDTLHRHTLRKAANAAMMAATELENDGGQVMALADLAAVSVSNKSIRRGELMTRITGCEKWAEAMQLRGVFLTLTCPSRFHRVHRAGGLNDKHDGSTPKDGQRWLSAAWARARAKLQRAGVGLFGFRVAEPHHDGCPHWHALLWCHPDQVAGAVHSLRLVWLQDVDGEGFDARPYSVMHGASCGLRGRRAIFLEPGAQEYRFNAKAMEPGGAAGYIAKYIAKNIDDAGAVATEGHTDDDYSGDVERPAQSDLFGGTAQRVEAWASAWGIRQFQAIGQPPVTVWRELRRIDAKDGATPRLGRALDACNRDGEDRADWAAYVLAQGGMNTGRNYLLRIATLQRMKAGRYEISEQPHIIGVTDTTGPGDVQLSNRREWKPRGQWTPSDKVRGPWAPRVSPWTRVNNCTRGGPLKAWTEAIKQDSGESMQPKGTHEPPDQYTEPDPGRFRDRIARIQRPAIVRH